MRLVFPTFAIAALALVVPMLPHAAQASPAGQVPNARTNFSFTRGTTYNLATDTLSLNGTNPVRSGSGAFAALTSITATGTLSFSNTINGSVNDAVTKLLSFTDGTQTFYFDALSVVTTGLSTSDGADSLSLSVQGNLYGGANAYDVTAASFDVSLTGVNGVANNTLGAVQDPPGLVPNPPPTDPGGAGGAPAPVPEPASIAMLALGLLATVFGIGSRRIARHRAIS